MFGCAGCLGCLWGDGLWLFMLRGGVFVMFVVCRYVLVRFWWFVC